ncbi:MAG TPA: EI24 domain-containing protein [Dongiaceae bacterium]|nr:EI24 domain-containing protein [Dongiaceae bacterium]
MEPGGTSRLWASLAPAGRGGYIGGTRARTGSSLISALAKALAQLSDPRIRRVVWLSVGLALSVLVALAIAIWFVVAQFQFVAWHWLDQVIEFVTGLGLIVAVWLLFPAAVSATVGLFLERVAGAVEARHYPQLGAPRNQSMTEAILVGLKFFGVTLLLNLLVIPFYFIPVVNLFVFYGLNGYLLGREYFETVALRRLEAKGAAELRGREKGRVFMAGVIIAVLLTVPILNLIAPVIATSFMLHLFEAMRRPAMRA